MTPYGIVADAMYNIFGEGTPPPSALLSADEMLIKCARELDLEAPWYWLMGVRHFSVFSEMKLYMPGDLTAGIYSGISVKPGHVYPFSYGSTPDLLLSDGPVDQKALTDQFKNLREVYIADNSIQMKNDVCTDDLIPPTKEYLLSGYIAYGNMEKMRRIDREVGEKLLSTVSVDLENGLLDNPNLDLGSIVSDQPDTGRVIGKPSVSAKPKFWFFGTDPVFQSYRDRLDPQNGVYAGFFGEAFCMNVFPRPDKDYTLIAVGEVYTSVESPIRSGVSAALEGSITFGNGDLSSSSPMYEKTLVNLLTKSLAMKFNYQQISQMYEREYMITLDKLRSDNDRKLSYGLKLEYNDL